MPCRRILASSCGRLLAVLSLKLGTFAFGSSEGQLDEDQVAGPVVLPLVAVTANSEDDALAGDDWIKRELRDTPFANAFVGWSFDLSEDLHNEDRQTAPEPLIAERLTPEERVNLRGFPIPLLRNGFPQSGAPETLGISQSIMIQGPLVPVLGRAAPGGVLNHVTTRPRETKLNRISAFGSSMDRGRVAFESTFPLLAKTVWARASTDLAFSIGPQHFSEDRAFNASFSVLAKHGMHATSVLAVDYRFADGVPAAGIPEYRPEASSKIVGPYLPLAQFNGNGPHSHASRRSGALSYQHERRISKSAQFRFEVQTWGRQVVQDRFTASVYSLELRRLEGVREPRHAEQHHGIISVHGESTLRFRIFAAEHKFLVSGSHTASRQSRVERGLALPDRNALPESVRRFDPFAPNFFRPAYSTEAYSRVVVDRDEWAQYSSLEMSDRASFRNGAIVASFGSRFDGALVEIHDRSAAAVRERLRDRTSQVSFHGGLNWQPKGWPVLLFAVASSAFDPTTPIDARTGRIQHNETTSGEEFGIRGRLRSGRIEFSVAGFSCINENISRRNPLYNDPIEDADDTQPQLVASGKERFKGARFDLKWQLSTAVALTVKASNTQAVTVTSPDLPHEVGKPLSRLPAYMMQSGIRIRSAPTGLSGGVSVQYQSGFVSNYEDLRRLFLEYGGFAQWHTNIGRSWRFGKRLVDVDLSVRNVFNIDVLRKAGRMGAGREFALSSRMTF